MAERPDRIPVLFIAGSGRCGSTMLDRILSGYDDIFAAGEIRNLWNNGWTKHGRCGCGQPLRSCPVWSQVLDLTLAEHPTPTPEALAGIMDHDFQARRIPLALAPPTRRRRLHRLEPVIATIDALYRSLREVTGAEAIVDASKDPLFGDLLLACPSLDVRVLHLVRDPRAVANSWSRPKLELGAQTESYMPAFSTAAGTLMWVATNEAARSLTRRPGVPSMTLRYEDFVREPQLAIKTMGEELGIPLNGSPFVASNVVDLAPSHSAWGNPSRFEEGHVELREDEKWRTEMSTAKRRVTDVLSWPSARRFGYR